MNENQERAARAQLLFLDKTLTPELSGEFTLPDYNSEIRRLLWVRPTFLPPTRFVGNGRADFSGPVHYEVLYVGPDGNLYATELEDNYAFSVPLDALAGFDAADGAEFSVALTPEAVVSRVTAPRKLSVRCRLRADVRGYAQKDLAAGQEGGEDADVQYLWEMNENGRIFSGGCETVEVSDTFTPTGEGELRLILARGSVAVNEASAATDCVHCRGDVVVDCLFSREGEDAPVFSEVRRIPFEADVPLDNITPDCRATAAGTVTHVTGTMNDEDGTVSLNATVRLTAEGQSEEPVVYLRDLFAPCHSTDCTVSEASLWHAGYCQNRRFGVSADVPFAELGMPTGAQPVDCVAEAEITEKSNDGTRTVLTGVLHCHVLWRADGEYGSSDANVPFRTVLEDPYDDVQISLTVPECRLRAERDRLHLDAEVDLSARAWKNEPVCYVGRARFAPVQPSPRADMEICYPAADETLWSVSKRYGVTPAAVAAANGIDGEDPGAARSLCGANYLLIPD